MERKIKKAMGKLLNMFGLESNGSSEVLFPPEGSKPSDFSAEVLAKLGNIRGFFNEDDAMHFYLILKMQESLSLRGDIFEIGSYFGRSTALMAHCLSEDERLVVCDAFETAVEDHYSSHPTINNLKESIRSINPDFDFSRLEIHDCLSNDLSLPIIETFRFAHIDGGHDTETAYRDIEFAAVRLVKNGIISIDDYEHPNWPGVTVAVDRFMSKHQKHFSIFADMNRHVAKGRKLYLIKH